MRIREFLLRPLDAKVADIRDQNFIALNVHDSQQEALNVFRKYDRTALPVTDSNGVLVGIVTVDDMLDVVVAPPAAAVPFAVGAYITGAYWFTSSTSFANPAASFARALTPTFAGTDLQPITPLVFTAANWMTAQDVTVTACTTSPPPVRC